MSTPVGPAHAQTQEASNGAIGSAPVAAAHPAAGFGPPSPPPTTYPSPGYPPAVPGDRRAVRFALIGVIVVCVVALVVIGTTWWVTSRSDDGQAPLAGQLTKEFPTAPSAAWTVKPSDFSGDRFVSPAPYGSSYNRLGGLADDTSVVTLVKSGTGDAHVVGVTADGRKWALAEPMDECASRITDHKTACSGPSSLVIVDTTTGSVLSRWSHSGAFGVEYDGTYAYLRSFPGQSGVEISKYGPRGLEWTKQYSAPDDGPGRGDSSGYLATSKLLATTAGGHVAVISTSNGRELVNRPGGTRYSALSDGSIVFAAAVKSGESYSSGPVIVVRPDGSIIELAGSSVTVPDVVAPNWVDTVFVDGKPVDIGRRHTSWATNPLVADPASSPPAVALATDQAIVMIDSRTTRLVALDPKTGTQKWATPEQSGLMSLSGPVTDGKRLLLVAKDSLIAIDSTTGQLQWSVPSSILGLGAPQSDDATTEFYALGDRLVTLRAQQITGFAPTGGDASAPGAPTRHTSSGDSYVTRCGSAPTFTPEQFSTASGGLTIRMKVTATCPDGDVLSGAQTRVTVKDGSNLVASGYFDFSGTPLALPKGDGDETGGSRSVELTFGAGSFYRLPNTLGSTSGGVTSTAGGTTYLVECDRGTETATEAPAPDSSSSMSAAATGPAVPPGTNLTLSVDDALRRQANADRSFIMTNLNNRWVAQLSSKRPGLVADGKTWTNADILDEFLALRLRFNDVRLLWSDEWPVFSYHGWWVTVAAATFPGPDAANSWCSQQSFDPGHCFAKLISTTAGPENSTRYWR